MTDISSDKYDFDPNDRKIMGRCLKKIVDTSRLCLVNEWESINNSQNRNDGYIKISEKRYIAIRSNLINSIISETAELKNSNEKFVAPYVDFFVNTIEDYFAHWWNRTRHFYEKILQPAL